MEHWNYPFSFSIFNLFESVLLFIIAFFYRHTLDYDSGLMQELVNALKLHAWNASANWYKVIFMFASGKFASISLKMEKLVSSLGDALDGRTERCGIPLRSNFQVWWWASPHHIPSSIVVLDIVNKAAFPRHGSGCLFHKDSIFLILAWFCFMTSSCVENLIIMTILLWPLNLLRESDFYNSII